MAAWPSQILTTEKKRVRHATTKTKTWQTEFDHIPNSKGGGNTPRHVEGHLPLKPTVHNESRERSGFRRTPLET